ncbi:hypothetical protein BHE74_00010323 [Ensete ventricosum]|nr:hypothetical protein GW17_00018718 [Ensete ventricosum]RWW81299.1 hypothetical protein BHE74_00010323 [Ensete ventricosum]
MATPCGSPRAQRPVDAIVAKHRVASTAIDGPYRATSYGWRPGTGGVLFVCFAPRKVAPVRHPIDVASGG